MHTVIRECSWNKWAAKPGDTIRPGDVPEDVLKALIGSKAVVPLVESASKVEAVPANKIKS